MSSVLLSICIPTFNRVSYLRELLPRMLAQIQALDQKGTVEVVVSDNASTDDTGAYCRSLNCSEMVYFRNEVNIGGDRNFLACVGRSTGKYVWLFGDDELLEDGGVSHVCSALIRLQPTLAILCDKQDGCDVAYADYRACLESEMKGNPLFPLAHTLITANVFLKSTFDLDYAKSRLFTNYAHMLGFMCSLRNAKGVATLSKVIAVRAQRAQFAHWPFALCIKQAYYLWCIAKWFRLPRLYGIALRVATNLPLEWLACLAHTLFPRVGRT